MWFVFDGCSFEIHDTLAKAKAAADSAMDGWSDYADEGWDECSTQVCYGRVTHCVRVEEIEINDDNRHLVHPDCESFEDHHLEPTDYPSYEEILSNMGEAGSTMRPAILLHAVRLCMESGAFEDDDSVVEFVKAEVVRVRGWPGGVLADMTLPAGPESS